MDQVVECFKNITCENAMCLHSTCKYKHYYQLVRNDKCSHGNLQNLPRVEDIVNHILTNCIHSEEANEEIDELLAGIFILSGGCSCKFSYETICFFANILGQFKPAMFNMLLNNWIVKLYLKEMPGTWGRETAFRKMIENLIKNDNLERVNELYKYVKPFYYGDEIPWIFEPMFIS